LPLCSALHVAETAEREGLKAIGSRRAKSRGLLSCVKGLFSQNQCRLLGDDFSRLARQVPSVLVLA
jgi:hypothetical protein